MNRFVSGLVVALGFVVAAPALAADVWWPKGGEEVGYTMYRGGEKVGKAKLTFSAEDGKITSVQDNRMKFDIGGIDVVTRFVFRETWKGDRFVEYSTHGQAKGGPEKRRFTLKVEPNEAGKLVVQSPRHGDRVAPDGIQPATFWHLNHILAY